MLAWAGFLMCTGAILYSGTRLAKYGDIIAEKSGLSRAWIGVIMMASITSLPELVTGISSVAVFNVPDIAVGDVFGSSVFNLLIIVLLDMMTKKPIAGLLNQGHILSAGFGIVLLGLAASGILFGGRSAPIGWVGPYSLLFLFIYCIAIRQIYTYEKRVIKTLMEEVAQKYEDVTKKEALTKYAANALVVVAAAIFLPYIGMELAVSTGLGQTFVGNIFISISTSLPEVVVSISALRLGSPDMAVGGLLGSNLFNMAILAVDDFFYMEGPLLGHASQANLASALTAIMMSAVVILAVIYSSAEKRIRLSWDTMGLAFLYLMNILLLYSLR